MTPLHSAVEELKNLNRQIVKLLRVKRIRGILKTIGIGFFLYRDVDQRISQFETQKALLIKSVESAINKTSEYQKQQLNAIEACHEFLSQDQKEKMLNLIGTFEADLEYLKPLNALDSKLISSTMEEITKSRQFIVDYNENLEKNIIKQKLMKLKDEILQAEGELKSYFEREQYFSKRELYSWKEKWKHLVSPIKEYIVKGVTGLDFQDSLPLIHEAHEKGEKLVEDRNKEYVEKEILKSELFEEIDGRVLTEEHRKAIVVDEARNLVVAGAGTGKTTTLLGKAFYLVSKKLATPEEVLLVAFNTAVAEKNERKINVKPGIRFPVKTYHSLGLDIIGQSRGERPTVSPLWEDIQKLELKERILDFVRRRMSEENFAKLVIDYFLVLYSSYKSVFEFKSLGEYYQYLKESEVRSLQGDLVRSFEECDIANFLYVNGINYLYEEDYKFRTADDKHPQYKPDFFLPDYDIYIEHFGIDRNKQPAPWISQEKYIEEMEWKERTHKKHGTTLIATYSYERKEGTLLSNLQSRLMEKGVALKPLPYNQILEKLNRRKVNSLASLLSTFLNLYKSFGKSLETLRTEISRDDERSRTFLDIFSAIYEDYSEHLRKKNHIDFNDMINDATSSVEQRKCISPFKYILVDEFQDISQSRYRFLKALLEQNNAKLFCVGDDWQSIYRFTGGDISIMVDFEKNFGFSETSFIQETWRFSNKLCDFSTKFIMENKFQIPKKIMSKKEEHEPAVTIVKDKTEKALNKIANEIGLSSNRSGDTARPREKLWIINRYNYIGKPKNLQKLIVDHPEIEIEYKTAHSSKGLETDYVAVIGLRSGILGFPCQIEDDPVLNLVLAKPEPMKNAEERRLFYVAITRAKKHVYLVIDNSLGVSPFVSEIEDKGYEINTCGTLAKTINCQECKTGIIVADELRIGHYRCSNYPYCRHKPRKCPKCQIGFLYKESVKPLYYECSDEKCSFQAKACPECEDGYLVPRQDMYGRSFFGCSNFSTKRCRHTEAS